MSLVSMEYNMFEYKYVYYVKNMIISDRKYIYRYIYGIYTLGVCVKLFG